jgi:UbiD family decarboxylase
MQVFDERTTGMHWQTQKHGAEHFRRARAANPSGRIEVAVAIGSDPSTCLAGILPVPPDLDEMMFAGFLRREPVEMVACETCSLEVPANAEIVLEGYVELGEMRTEGPFGDHTGFLFACGRVSGVSRHLRNAPPRSYIYDHRGGATAAGRFFSWGTLWSACSCR